MTWIVGEVISLSNSIKRIESTRHFKMAAKIIKGPKPTVEVEKGVAEYFFDAVEEYGDRMLQIDPFTGKSESYIQVKKRCVRLAIYLRQIGIKMGDVIMHLCKNDFNATIPLMAGFCLGAPISSLDMKLSLFDIKHYIETVKPKAIIVIEERLELIEKALNEINFYPNVIVIGGNSCKYPNLLVIQSISVEGEDSFKPVEIDVNTDPAVIIFSSGTTNLPKPVVWNHKTVMYWPLLGKRLAKMNIPWSVNLRVRWTLFWSLDITTTLCCILNGTPALPVDHIPSTEEYLEVLHKYQVEHEFFDSPVIHSFLTLQKEVLHKYDLSHLKTVVVGGSPVHYENILKLREILPHTKIFKLYGSTEMGGPAFLWPYELTLSSDYDTKPDSCGIVQEGMEVKVVDVNTRELLGPNQQGEILVKSHTEMIGFYNRPIPPEIYDEDGFLKSGDLGYYDESEHFFVVERVNELYKFMGYWICPSITEHHLIKLDAVKEAVVVGVHHLENEYHGAACIVLNEGFKLTEEEIDKYIRENLGDLYRLLGGVKFVEDLPRTPTGKVRRRDIRAMFQEKQIIIV